MRDILEERGHEVVQNVEKADVIVINTCAVRLETEYAMIRRLRELKGMGKRIIVAGCLASTRPGLISSIIPDASLIGPDAVELIGEVVETESKVILLDGTRSGKLPRYRGGITYVVPIESGCLGACTYCIDRIARRRLYSYPVNEIVKNIRYAVQHGAKEIYLTGQDVASYGVDIGINLVQLIRRILLEVPGKYKIRIGMMEPHMFKDMLSDFIRLYRDHRIYNHVHLPLQSGDDKVLKAMNRRYTVSEYKYIVMSLREEYPYLNLTTDIIVGFPGEDENAFKNTKKAIEEIKPDKVNVARYSIRTGTLAATMPQIPEAIKKRRSRELTQLCQKIAYERNKMLLGEEIEALIVSKEGDKAIGRAWNYKRVIIMNCDSNIGEFVKVRIDNVTRTSLIARAI